MNPTGTDTPNMERMSALTTLHPDIGTASPVRAVFSSTIADGDTFLMGEMAGVNEGLVIQELSRADELVKLQHELEKQVGKLAELEELKWLEQLEKLQTEEIQKVKDSIGEMEKNLETEVKEAKGEVAIFLGVLGAGAEIKGVKELVKQWEPKVGDSKGLRGQLVKKLEELAKKWEPNVGSSQGLKGQVGLVKDLKKKLEELETIKGLKEGVDRLEELDTLEGPEDLEKLEAEKTREVKQEKEEVEKLWSTELKGKLEELKGGDLKETLNKLEKEALKKIQAVKDKIKIAEEHWLKAGQKEIAEKVKDKVGKLEKGLNEQLEALKKLEALKEIKVEELTAEEVKKEIKDLGELVQKVEIGQKLEELEKDGSWLFKDSGLKEVEKKIGEIENWRRRGEIIRRAEHLKSKLEELAAIKELKELGLEERLRELAEVKEVRAKPCVLDWV